MLDVIEEVQRQEAAASSWSPGGASECSPGSARAGALRAGLGQRRPIFILSPRIARFWAIRGERLGEGGICCRVGSVAFCCCPIIFRHAA